ncbi:hypothetical protein J3R83DRAFT_10730 [Lanmaoa asiatica]|nr:hypothetical protein J3R83DRAFT_10730 [Lanmaoa asiatica]
MRRCRTPRPLSATLCLRFLQRSVDLPYSEEFEDGGEIWRDHRGPKPIWESLTSNAPSVRWVVKVCMA